MLDFAKIVHEAIGIESPRTFIGVFAIFGLLFFGGIGWLIDRGYRVKLREQVAHASNASTPTLPQSTTTSTVQVIPKLEPKSGNKSKTVKHKEPDRSQTITQTAGPGGINSVATGNATVTNTVINQEAGIIRSLELHIELDLPTAPSQINEKASSMGLASAIALFDGQKNRYRFITDYQFVDWQMRADLHRFGFVYKPETPTEIVGQRIDFLSHIEMLVVNFADFISTTLPSLLTDGSARIELKVLLNGIEVNAYNATPPMETITQGQANMNVSEGFKTINSSYRAQLLKRTER
jgi:hypothetical protein